MNDEVDYANSIKSILDLPESEYKLMCERAKEAVKEYDYPFLTKQMAEVIEKL